MKKMFVNVSLKIIFKRLVVLLLLINLSLLLGIFFESEKVANANEILFSQLSDTQWFIMIAALIVYFIHLINLYLLYKFKNIAKQMYLILFVVTIIIILSSRVPIIFDTWYYILDGLASTLGGAILVLLYFSPIKNEFIK